MESSRKVYAWVAACLLSGAVADANAAVISDCGRYVWGHAYTTGAGPDRDYGDSIFGSSLAACNYTFSATATGSGVGFDGESASATINAALEHTGAFVGSSLVFTASTHLDSTAVSNPIIVPGPPPYPASTVAATGVNQSWTAVTFDLAAGETVDYEFELRIFGASARVAFDLTGETLSGSDSAELFYRRAGRFTAATASSLSVDGWADASVSAYLNPLFDAQTAWYEYTLVLTPVPLPAALWLFATGICGLLPFGLRRRPFSLPVESWDRSA